MHSCGYYDEKGWCRSGVEGNRGENCRSEETYRGLNDEGDGQSVADDMLQLASGKSVPVMMNCAALSDPEKTKSLRLPILRGEIGGREVDVMRDTGCEGVVVRRHLVDAGQLTGECCLLLRIDNTALLAEKAVINLRTPFLSREVKAMCIPDAICDVIVGNVDGASSPEDPDMSVIVGAAMTRAQAKRDAVTKPLRVADMERHGGVEREQLIKLQQEDPRIQELVDADRTSRRGGKVVSFEKARGIVYRQYEDPGRNVSIKQVMLPQVTARICDVSSPRFPDWSRSWDQENEGQSSQ
ncbi:hypothetical protein ElyMa_003293700 [Elysia marginata]|uniref:Uncharacterized protein n=1 Tax=Elysia marginata TaxID=1093978 RepID=A0AAV4JCD0_9GAST|nr:hypothetical protein ElyMa_003293700 [Elysia marginata]